MRTNIGIEDKALRKRLQEMSKAATSPVVQVGHTANYALAVHETHLTKPKFLERSLRRAKPLVKRLVTSFFARGATFGQALFMVGLNVQRESQKATPVDTGFLKGTAFTRLTEGGREIQQEGLG